MKKIVQEMLDHNISCTKNIDIDSIIDIVRVLQEARDSNRQVFIFGNGGSASTASHLAADLQKTALLKNKNRFRAMSLVDNIEVVSAWSNDVSYDDIFAEQIKNFANDGDVVVAISGSGNSNNVVRAVDTSSEIGCRAIVLTGGNGGELCKRECTSVVVDSFDMLTIETIHLMICHIVVSLIRKNGEPIFQYR
tara:strand:+ start:586 stop:1164 length:579 start_codon:yes stop_codon:yes gene_type:complete